MNSLSPSPLLTPLTPPSFSAAPHHCPLAITFQLHGESSSCLSWVTPSDAQVTKAQRCPVSILLSVNSELSQMLAEATVPTRSLEHTDCSEGFINFFVNNKIIIHVTVSEGK